MPTVLHAKQCAMLGQAHAAVVRVAVRWLGSNAVAVDRDLVFVFETHVTVLTKSAALQTLIANNMKSAFESHDVVRVVLEDGNVELTPNPGTGAHCTNRRFVEPWTPPQATARAWELICDAAHKPETTLAYTTSEIQRLKRIAVMVSRYSKNDVLAGRFYCCKDDCVSGLWHEKYKNSDSARNSATIVRAIFARALDRRHMVFKTYQHCSQRLKDDESLASKACFNDPNNLALTSQRLRSNKPFVRRIVNQDGNAIMYACQALKDDEDVVFDAVVQDGMALRFASQRLRSRPEIARAAVKQNALALAFVWGPLKNDPGLVEAALTNQQKSRDKWEEIATPHAFIAHESVSKATLQLAVSANSQSLLFMSDAQRGDADIVSCAFKNKYHDAVWCIADELRNNSEFLSRALFNIGDATDMKLLLLMSDSIRNNKEAVTEAVDYDGLQLRYASDALRDDKNVVVFAVAQNEKALEWASERVRSNPDILLID